MAWVRLDDGYDDNKKVVEAGWEAAWLNVRALCYSNRNLTDGYLSRGALDHVGSNFPPRKRPLLADKLCIAGLWAKVEDGWQILNFTIYQPSREKVLAEREAAKTRMATARGANTARSSGEHSPNKSRNRPRTWPYPVPEVPSEPIGGGSASQPKDAWADVLDSIRAYGRSNRPVFIDPATEAAVRSVGWARLCDLSERDAQRAFKAAYTPAGNDVA